MYLRTEVFVVEVIYGLYHADALDAKDPLNPNPLELVRYCEEVLHRDGVGLYLFSLGAVETSYENFSNAFGNVVVLITNVLH